jgi:hypothetical protein
MNGHDIENLGKVLQASISPVALVSGVGLLILSQTNRLGRVMDRLRGVIEQRRLLKIPDAHLERELSVLQRRARILRAAITAAVFSALLASVLVLLLFTTAVFGTRMDVVIVAMFATSLLSLILSLVLFICDMNMALRAVQEELLR